MKLYKATRPDGTDFRTGTVRYEVGKTTIHPGRGKAVRNDPATYLSVSTTPTDCTGMRWPCRLFLVEGVGRTMRNDRLPNKRCFAAVTVIEELPVHEVFGPHGADVVRVIDQARTLTYSHAQRLAAAWAAAWDAAWDAAGDAAGAAAWDAAWDAARAAARAAARDAARAAAWDAAGDAAGAAAWDAAWDAARAYVVRDLITPEQFDLLAGPWISVMGDQ